MSNTIIPNIEEIRAISEERNKKDIKDYIKLKLPCKHKKSRSQPGAALKALFFTEQP